MRSYIAEIPDGARFEDFFDNDGMSRRARKALCLTPPSGTI